MQQKSLQGFLYLGEGGFGGQHTYRVLVCGVTAGQGGARETRARADEGESLREKLYQYLLTYLRLGQCAILTAYN